MSTKEELQKDIDAAEAMLEGFNPNDYWNTSAAFRVWHAINEWRSGTQWFLDRKDPEWKPTVSDSRRHLFLVPRKDEE